MLVERQLQLPEDRRHHLRAEDLVAVERPADLGIVSLRQRLGDVVQHGGPAQPQIAAAAGDVVQHLERMDKIVLMGMRAPLLDALEVVHLRENQFQKPRQLQQFEAHRGYGRKDDLVKFRSDAFARHDPDAVRIAADGVEGLAFDREPQLRREAHGPHHAQRVVRKGNVGIARRADDALFEVVHAVERIDQLAERTGVERPRHGVDREVAAALVVFERARLDLRFARILRIGLTAGAHELDLDALVAEHGRAEGLEYRDLGVQFAAQRFGQRDTAAHDHHVDVGRGAAQEMVAHVTAYDESPHALLLGQTRDSPEYGIRQRHAATSRIFRSPSSTPDSPRPSGAGRRWCTACRACPSHRPTRNRRRHTSRSCALRKAFRAACWSR